MATCCGGVAAQATAHCAAIRSESRRTWKERVHPKAAVHPRDASCELSFKILISIDILLMRRTREKWIRRRISVRASSGCTLLNRSVRANAWIFKGFRRSPGLVRIVLYQRSSSDLAVFGGNGRVHPRRSKNPGAGTLHEAFSPERASRVGTHHHGCRQDTALRPSASGRGAFVFEPWYGPVVPR